MKLPITWFVTLLWLVLMSSFVEAQAPVRTNTLTGSWTDTSDNEAGFKFYLKKGDGTYQEIGNVGANIVTFAPITVTGAEGSVWCFAVTAFNEAGESVRSGDACYTVPIQIPTRPVLTASINSAKTVTLNWTDTDNEVNYEVFRNGVKIATLGANILSFAEAVTGTAGTLVAYEVAAVNSAGATRSVAVTVKIPQTVPNAPTGLGVK
jgi:hypothetical protein